MTLPEDPIDPAGIPEFGKRLRNGDVSARAAAKAYLDRIEALDPVLSAYVHVDGEAALRSAEAIDRLLAAGTDLGPLMGVPVAVKDIIAVSGMPTGCGSLIPVGDLIGEEGSFVRRLRRLGCVILGKLNTVEFATGNTGLNLHCGTPRNPWDPKVFRLPSGSSSGSAVAMAAGLCGFAIGTDTGGSVRGPAAFCGTFGIRPSPGLWSTDGMFSVSTTLDTPGVFTRTARDAAVVHAALLDCPPVRQADLRGVTLARPRTFFFDGLDEQVARCMDASLARLSDLGVRFLEVDIPEAAECDALYNSMTRAETIATFGIARFRENLESLNPDVRARIEPGLGVSSEAYIRALRRRDTIRRHACRAMRGFDGMISPTKRRLSPPSPADPGAEDHRRLAEFCGGPTRPASIFGFCASSQPIHQLGSALPVGLQLMCPGGQDARLLSTAMAVEAGLGPAPRPDLHALLTSTSPPTTKML